MKFETKVKIQDFYIKHKNYFGLGFSLVYDIKSYVSIFLLAILTIQSFGWTIPYGILLILALISIAGFWCIGKYLDRIGFYQRQHEFNNKRNIFVKEVRDEIIKGNIGKRNSSRKAGIKNNKR